METAISIAVKPYNAMMNAQPLKHDLTGKKFSRMTVISFAFYKERDRSYYWNCICDCGIQKIAKGATLRSGATKSCGCLQREKAKSAGDRTRTHGMSKTKIYSVWDSMIQRCSNKNRKDFKSYGARGISVCERWMAFENFYLDMGEPKKGMSIDRIDADKGYSPDNCRWATTKEQSRNTTRSRLISANGETRCIAEWSEYLGVTVNTIAARLRRGWSDEDAINRPVDKKFSRTNVLRKEQSVL